MQKGLNKVHKTRAKMAVNGPTRQGAVLSSMLPVPMAAPRRAQNQGGQLVGGMPVNFGVGAAKKAAPRGAAGKTKRAKMY